MMWWQKNSCFLDRFSTTEWGLETEPATSGRLSRCGIHLQLVLNHVCCSAALKEGLASQLNEEFLDHLEDGLWNIIVVLENITRTTSIVGADNCRLPSTNTIKEED